MTTFPAYFLESTLPRIGGKIVVYRQAEHEIGVGFLFPRLLNGDGSAIYTLRFHPFVESNPATPATILYATNQLLAPQQAVFYDPNNHRDYTQFIEQIEAVTLGHPSQDEAAQIPALQRQVWGATPEECYPADIHSLGFALGTSLVARVEGQLAGFLIGFSKFGGYSLPADWRERFNGGWRLESQIMGVLPQFRGLRLANLLKQEQAGQASAAGIGIINWTADPLQFVNAALNFGLLRALAFDFLPNLYAFRNQLNRIPASRFGLTWLVQSERVRQQLHHAARSTVLDLAEQPAICRVNDGWQRSHDRVNAPQIAIEIPADWNALQQHNLDEAWRWRAATDTLFARYIGKEEGKYVITGVASDDARRYLIGERCCSKLWERLGQAENPAINTAYRHVT